MICNKRLIALLACGAFSAAFSICIAADAPKFPATTQSATQPATQPKVVKPERPKIDENYALAFYKEHMPEAYSFVMMVKSKDPKAYDTKLKQEIINDTTRMYNVKTNRPAEFPSTVRDNRLTFRSAQLSKEIRTPSPGRSDADVAQMRRELTEVATEQFEVRQELRKIQLAELERRLEELKKQLESTQKQIDEREKNKQAAILKHVEDMLKPRPRMDW